MSLLHESALIDLPTTGKFIWKFRAEVLNSNSPDHLQLFLKQKKRKILSGYGFTLEESESKSFLASLPAPEKMKHAFYAAQRVLNSIENGEKITIFGDFDVDGTTSCAMLYEFFLALGTQVEVYIPDRLTEGYGLNSIGLQKCVDKGTKLIITVDNGISSIDACALAKKLNVDVIITDHHDLPTQIPDAYAILNPKQPDCNFGFTMLAGVGVALYLMMAIRVLLRKENPHFSLNLKHFLDYVAIGTIADLAPLVGVNHILCKVGLEVLNMNIQNGQRPGLYELLTLSGWEPSHTITAYDIGYKIGPRLNAAGRLGNALNSVTLMTTKDPDEALSCASFLHEENANRQILQKSMTAEALLMAKTAIHQYDHAIVLHKDEWHPGVVGLVASRVLEAYYKPTIILGTNENKFKGSGRSTHAFDLFHVLDDVRTDLCSFGGHYHAVGLSFDKSKFEWLRSYLNQKAEELIPTTARIPILLIDGVLPIIGLKEDFLDHLVVLEPFGQENSEPQWLVGPVQVRNVYRIGQDKTQGHAKVTLTDSSGSCKLTAFGTASKFEEFLESGTDVYVVVKLKKRTWKSKIYLDILIVDFAPVMYLSEPKCN